MVYIFDDMNEFKEADYNIGYRILTNERRKKVDSYLFYKDKKLSVLAFLLLRYAIKKEYGIIEILEMNYNKYGKPKLKSYPNIYFNISHCKSSVACIVDDEEVGIDVQNIVYKSDSLINKVLTNNEAFIVKNSSDVNTLFTKFWTLKESYFKFKGTGLCDNFDSIDFSNFINYEKFMLEEKIYISKRIKDYYLAICGFNNHNIQRITKSCLLSQ